MARKFTVTRDERYPHHHVRWQRPEHAAEVKRKKRTTSMLLAAPPLAVICIAVLGCSIYRLWTDSPEKPEITLQTVMSPLKVNTKKAPPPPPEVELPKFPAEQPHEIPKPQPMVIEIPPPIVVEPEMPKAPEVPKLPELPPPPVAVEPLPPPAPKLVEIPTPELKPIETPKPKVEVAEVSYEVPVVFTVYNELRGDSPMKRTWNILLTVALASASSPAIAQVPKDAATKSDVDLILKRLDQMDQLTKKTIKDLTAEAAKTSLAVTGINKDIGSINKDIGKIKEDFSVLKGNDLQRKVDIDGVKVQMGTIEKKMAKMESDLKKLRDLIPDVNPIPVADFSEIKARLSKIEQALTQLQSKSRTAFSKTTGAGRVLIINQYFEDLLFIVGNEQFRVPAGGSRILDAVPAGAISYEVVSPSIGSVTRRNSTVEDKGTLQITVR